MVRIRALGLVSGENELDLVKCRMLRWMSQENTGKY